MTLVIFQCPESIYLERNRQQDNSIPDDILTRQLELIEFPELDESDRTIVVNEKGETITTYGYCR